MKHPLLFLLAFVDLNGFSQAPDTLLQQFDKIWTSGGRTLTIHPGINGEPDTLSFDIRMRPRYDTIRAELLVTFTSRRWGVAHARPGYVVMKTGEVVGYLSDRKKRFPVQVKVWGWVKPGETKINCVCQ